jgi:hypothetical protein
MGSGALCNGAEIFHAGPAPAAKQMLQALSKRFGDDTRHGFPCLLSDCDSEAMSLRVFDIEAFHREFPPFYRIVFKSTTAESGERLPGAQNKKGRRGFPWRPFS